MPTNILLSPWKEVAGASGPSEAESRSVSLFTEDGSPDTTGTSLDKRKRSLGPLLSSSPLEGVP